MMANVIRQLTAKEKEGMIEICGVSKSKLELDAIEKEWIKKNKEAIELDGEKAVISCIRCHKLDYGSGLVYTDNWSDYKHMTFVSKKKNTVPYKERGQWFKSLLGHDYTFLCPVCQAQHELFIEYRDEMTKEQIQRTIDKLKDKLKEVK
jgi:hypothetical protein